MNQNFLQLSIHLSAKQYTLFGTKSLNILPKQRGFCDYIGERERFNVIFPTVCATSFYICLLAPLEKKVVCEEGKKKIISQFIQKV